MRGRRRIVAAGLVLAMVAGTSGCWLQPRLGPERQNHLGGDAELDATTVAGLVPLWSTEVPAESQTVGSVKAPVAAGGGVYAVADVAGAADFGWYAGVRVDADTGAVRWSALHENITLALPMFLDDPVITDGQLVARYYIAVPERIIFSGGDEWDLGTGARRPPGGGPDVPAGVTGDLALADGRVVGKSLTQTPLPPTTPDPAVSAIEGWTFRPQVVGERVLGDWALVGSQGAASDGIAWSDGGTSATGYLPDCPEVYGVPRSEACGPNWTRDLGAAPGNPTDAGGDTVVYADASGTVWQLWMASGEVVSQAEVGGGPLAQPAVADDRIVTATADGRVVVLPTGPCDDRSGVCTPLWEGTVGAPGSFVLVVGDVVYVATSAGTIAAFPVDGCGAATCEPLVTVDAGSPITGSPIVFDGKLIAGTQDGHLVAFGLPS